MARHTIEFETTCFLYYTLKKNGYAELAYVVLGVGIFQTIIQIFYVSSIVLNENTIVVRRFLVFEDIFDTKKIESIVINKTRKSIIRNLGMVTLLQIYVDDIDIINVNIEDFYNNKTSSLIKEYCESKKMNFIDENQRH